MTRQDLARQCRANHRLAVLRHVEKVSGNEHGPDDPVGRLLFNVLGMVAEFESDLMKRGTRERMAIARVDGKLNGEPPKLPPARQRHLIMLWEAGSHTQDEPTELFEVSRTTIHREIKRHERVRDAQAQALGQRVLLGGGGVDTHTPMGSMVFTVLAALAQMELGI